jgi:hypothetical protein
MDYNSYTNHQNIFQQQYTNQKPTETKYVPNFSQNLKNTIKDVGIGIKDVGVGVGTGIKDVGVGIGTGIKDVGVGIKDVGVGIGKSTKKIGIDIKDNVVNAYDDTKDYIESTILSITPYLTYFIFHVILCITALLLFYRCNVNLESSNVVSFMTAILFPWLYIIFSVIYYSGICKI